MSKRPFDSKLSRRALLETLGGAALLSPFVPLFSAEAQAAAPKRICFFFTPNGLYDPALIPTGTETAFTFGEILQPLEAYKQQILFLNGLDITALGANMFADHPTAAPYLLTGAAPGTSPSIDQLIASRIGSATRFPSLLLSTPNPSSGPYSVFSRGLDGRPIASLNWDPKSVWNQYFSSLPTGPIPDPKAARLAADRKSVLDNVLTELNTLTARVGKDDRYKIQAHVDGLRATETRLAQPPPPVATCQAPAVPGNGYPPGTVTSAAEYMRIGRQQFDNLAHAFACDLTRVGYFQWTDLQGGTSFPFATNGEHSLSHFEPFSLPNLISVGRYYAEQFAYFLGKLRAVPEGSGTLLDNTLVVWFTEHAVRDGSHAHDNMSFILAGGAGGAVRSGRLLKYSHAPTNKLFVSLANAMGVPLTQFGKPGISTGPLPGLA